MQTPLSYVVTQGRQFLAALDPDPAARYALRSFDDHGDDPRLAVKAYGALDRGIRQSSDPAKNGRPCRPTHLFSYMQGMGAGVFAAPNRLDGQGQGQANVVAIRDLFVDADSRLAVERLLAFITTTGLTPTILVASGGMDDGVEKLHAYWRIEGCPVPEFRDAQLALVSRLGTDPAVQDAGRVMRLPGFWHLKREPRQTRIVSLNPTVEYEFSAFRARVLAQPQIVDPWAGGKGVGRSTALRTGNTATAPAAGPTARLRVLLDAHGSLITPAVRALLREAVAPAEGRSGNRHATLVAVAARCMQAGWSDDDIRNLALPVVNDEWGDGDWSGHLNQILAWTRAQEAASIAATRGVVWPSLARRARGAA
jgi:hypothetical protein